MTAIQRFGGALNGHGHFHLLLFDGVYTRSTADPCGSITRAVWLAKPHDTTKVGYGTFVELYGVTIDKSLAITGNGSLFATVVRPEWEFTPVFKILPGANVTLTGMMIYRGSGYQGGGIENAGTLTLNDVRIFNNSNAYSSTSSARGAIFNDIDAELVMVHVGIEHNSTEFGLLNMGTAIVVESWIMGTYGQLISDGVGSQGTLLMLRSLIAANEGNGIRTVGSSTTVLTNVTISGNHLSGVETIGGQTTLTHVTIVNNGGYGVRVPQAGVDVWLRNSIVAKNKSVTQCWGLYAGLVHASSSLLGDASCLGPFDSTNLVGVEPKLSALASALAANRWKRTHALLPGSPAIDAAASDDCESTDQRGIQRPLDGDSDGTATCDMGAYEYVPPKPGLTRDPPGR